MNSCLTFNVCFFFLNPNTVSESFRLKVTILVNLALKAFFFFFPKNGKLLTRNIPLPVIQWFEWKRNWRSEAVGERFNRLICWRSRVLPLLPAASQFLSSLHVSLALPSWVEQTETEGPCVSQTSVDDDRLFAPPPLRKNRQNIYIYVYIYSAIIMLFKELPAGTPSPCPLVGFELWHY